MPEATPLPQIEIPLRTVCFIVLKARQFSLQDFETGSDAAFNASDGTTSGVLEDTVADTAGEELLSFIADLNEDEQVDLVTLVWLGRGDADVHDWRDLHDEAQRLHNASTGRYLLSFPLLADYLEAGLAQIGLSCSDLDEDRL
ncbi:MAG TPA: DUF3775 domain-containing protein [Ensifer sp.]|nr:DUF3775 domain-containing protein [Ensifer sp.]